MLRTLALTLTFRRQVALAGGLAVAAALTACGGKDSAAPVCAVTAVAVAPSTGSIAVGETLNLSASITQTNCTGLTTNWTSSNPAVATVTSTGTVTGVGVGGPVLITATANAVQGSAAINVTPAAIATIALSLASPVVNEGQTVQVAAAVADARGNALAGRTLTWSSSNTAVASVDGTGRLTGVSPGAATITARDPGNPNVSGTVAITVRAVVQRVQVTAPAPTLVVGQTVALTATVTSTSNQPITDRTPTWSSSNSAVATVTATGEVTGVSAGTTTIQATSDGVSGSVTLTVAVPVVTTLTLTGVPAQAPVGLPINITPQLRDQNGNLLSGRAVRWSVSNARVAIVRPLTPFTVCAAEGATCAFTGTKLVRIVGGGPVNNFVYKEATNGTPCTVADVGDPLTGSGGYSCEVAELPSTVGVTALRALGTGTVTLTARAVDAPTVLATATINIVAAGGKVTSWTLVCSGACEGPTDTLNVGGGINVWTLAFDDQPGSPNFINVPLVVSSSNPAVLSVQNVAENRRTDLIALAPGTATITFSASLGATAPALSLRFAVKGTAVPVANVSLLFLNGLSLVVGQTTQGTASTRDASGNVLTGRTVTWSSSNTAVATVNGSGLVTAVGAGSATITATSEGVNATANITVTAAVVPVASVTVALSPPSIAVGATSQGTATTRDAANNVLTGRSIAWSSANTSIAAVNSTSGAITAVAPGTTTISATSEGRTGSATITVTSAGPAVARVNLANTGSNVLRPGNTSQLGAVPLDANFNQLTGRTVVWTSSNANVASVSSTGLVTAISTGTTTVTATIEGVSTSAPYTVISGAVFASQRLAYASIFQAGGTLTIYGLQTENYAGGPVTVAPLGTGHWRVKFANMARAAGQSDAAFVSPEDGNHCVIDNWANSGADMDVEVRCYALPGFAPATNASFQVLLVGNGALQARNAFAFADQPSSAAYTAAAATSHSSAGGTIPLARTSLGQYTARLGIFPRPGGINGQAEVPMVSLVAAGGSTAICESQGAEVGVGLGDAFQTCATTGSAYADARYNLMFVSGGRAGAPWGIGYFSTDASRMPGFNAQSNGQLPTYSAGTTRITVTMSALANNTGKRAILVFPAFNQNFNTGTIRWTTCGTTTVTPTTASFGVWCRDAGNNVVASDFTAVMIQ